MATATETLLSAILKQLELLPARLIPPKSVMGLEEFCEYTGTSRRYAYRLTSENRVPHYKPNGKKIFFRREEVDKWLTQGRVSTAEEIEDQATSHLVKKGRVA